jgi:hypothetical protein
MALLKLPPGKKPRPWKFWAYDPDGESARPTVSTASQALPRLAGSQSLCVNDKADVQSLRVNDKADIMDQSPHASPERGGVMILSRLMVARYR